MRICVDHNLCTGHGVCEGLDPEVFEVGDDGVVHLLLEHPPEDKRDVMQDAVDQCPTQALDIRD